MPPAFERAELKPSKAELAFDEFLKSLELHHTQSVCGLGWVERNYSNSGRYTHSVGLDVVNPAIRSVLPNNMGSRNIFRFMVPKPQPPAPMHLTTSNQQLYVPGLDLKLPSNPNLELDISALLMLIKSQAARVLDEHLIPITPETITTLMAVWVGLSNRLGSSYSRLYEHESKESEIVKLYPELMQWLLEASPAYLTVLKFVRPEQTGKLSLEEALEARGISSHQLSVLYPLEPPAAVQ